MPWHHITVTTSPQLLCCPRPTPCLELCCFLYQSPKTGLSTLVILDHGREQPRGHRVTDPGLLYGRHGLSASLSPAGEWQGWPGPSEKTGTGSTPSSGWGQVQYPPPSPRERTGKALALEAPAGRHSSSPRRSTGPYGEQDPHVVSELVPATRPGRLRAMVFALCSHLPGLPAKAVSPSKCCVYVRVHMSVSI